MKISIDGSICELKESKKILDAVKQLGLDSDTLKERPLAAQIGGQEFSLNFVPVKDTVLHLIRYGEDRGARVYERSLQFMFILAVRKLFPSVRVHVRYSLGTGLYITLEGAERHFTQDDILLIQSEMRRVCRANIPLERKRISIKEALEFFEADGQLDKARLLKWRKFSYFDVYQVDGYMDYFYGEMVPSTSYIDVFGIKYLGNDAMVLLLPRKDAPDVVAEYTPMPKLSAVFRQSDDWAQLMTCATANELNTRVESGRIREIVRVNESLHDRGYASIADKIVHSGAKAIMLAGPSSSGKTTSANRIATQLRVQGLDPQMISLDDYYIDRDMIPRDPDGSLDLESITTLDIPRFSEDLAALIDGAETEIPEFDFGTGKRKPHGRAIKLLSDQPLIVEGIHGLNPKLLAGKVDKNRVFKVYVSALTTLNLDDHNRIKTTDIRLLRRLVRDYNTRNASMEHTLGMWPSVRRGEEKWIFPYQEQADAVMNTTLLYEVSVLKHYVYPLLRAVPPESEHYATAMGIVKYLNYILDAGDIEDEIPPTSIIREFIGGNTYYRK